MKYLTNCNANIYRGETLIGRVSGNWRAKFYNITLGGDIVCRVQRKTALMGHVFGFDSYKVEIEKGADVAFVCMVIIALDEMYHDD